MTVALQNPAGARQLRAHTKVDYSDALYIRGSDPTAAKKRTSRTEQRGQSVKRKREASLASSSDSELPVKRNAPAKRQSKGKTSPLPPAAKLSAGTEQEPAGGRRSSISAAAAAAPADSAGKKRSKKQQRDQAQPASLDAANPAHASPPQPPAPGPSRKSTSPPPPRAVAGASKEAKPSARPSTRKTRSTKPPSEQHDAAAPGDGAAPQPAAPVATRAGPSASKRRSAASEATPDGGNENARANANARPAGRPSRSQAPADDAVATELARGGVQELDEKRDAATPVEPGTFNQGSGDRRVVALPDEIQRLADRIDQSRTQKLERANARVAALERSLAAALEQLSQEQAARARDADEAGRRHRASLDAVKAATAKDAELIATLKQEYRKVYGKYKQLRTENHEGLKEVFDGMWDTICKHKASAEELAELWEQEATRQSALVAASGGETAAAELSALRGEVAALKLDAIAAAKAAMAGELLCEQQARLIAHLKRGAPETAEAAVQCESAVRSVGVGGGPRAPAGPSGIAPTPVRRRISALGLTSFACSMVPEGVGLSCVDSELLQQGFFDDEQVPSASTPSRSVDGIDTPPTVDPAKRTRAAAEPDAPPPPPRALAAASPPQPSAPIVAAPARFGPETQVAGATSLVVAAAATTAPDAARCPVQGAVAGAAAADVGAAAMETDQTAGAPHVAVAVTQAADAAVGPPLASQPQRLVTPAASSEGANAQPAPQAPQKAREPEVRLESATMDSTSMMTTGQLACVASTLGHLLPGVRPDHARYDAALLHPPPTLQPTTHAPALPAPALPAIAPPPAPPQPLLLPPPAAAAAVEACPPRAQVEPEPAPPGLTLPGDLPADSLELGAPSGDVVCGGATDGGSSGGPAASDADPSSPFLEEPPADAVAGGGAPLAPAPVTQPDPMEAAPAAAPLNSNQPVGVLASPARTPQRSGVSGGNATTPPGLVIEGAPGQAGVRYRHVRTGFEFVVRPVTSPGTPFTALGRNQNPDKELLEYCPVLEGGSGAAARRLPDYLQKEFDFPADTVDRFHAQLALALDAVAAGAPPPPDATAR